MKKISLKKSKRFAAYVKKNLILMMVMMMMWMTIKSIIKSEIIVITMEKLEELLIIFLRYKTPKEITVVFHNGSAYDYHFIVNQLAKEFNGKL